MILAKTVKGYGLGVAGEGKNIAHNVKKMDKESIRIYRDRFNIPVSDEDLENLPYYKFDEASEEYQYLKARVMRCTVLCATFTQIICRASSATAESI